MCFAIQKLIKLKTKNYLIASTCTCTCLLWLCLYLNWDLYHSRANLMHALFKTSFFEILLHKPGFLRASHIG